MHYIVLYPQNDDHIMTIDSVTSLHPRVCQIMSKITNYAQNYAVSSYIHIPNSYLHTATIYVEQCMHIIVCFYDTYYIPV